MRALTSALALLLLACGTGAYGQTCTALSAGTWFAAARWSCTLPTANRIPLATDNVVIPNFAITVDTANAVAANVSMASGNNNGSLTISATRALTVGGTVNLSASTLAGNNRAKTIVVAGTLTAASMTIDGQASNTRQAQLVINNGLVDIGGTVTVTANANTDISFCTTAACGATAGGTLNVAGNLGSGAQFTAGTGTVTYDGTGAQNVGTYAYNNLTVSKSSGTAVLLANVTVGGNLTVNCPASCTNGTFDLSSFTANRTAAGGTISVGAGARLLIGGTNSFPMNYTTHTLNVASTVEFDGTAQTVAAENYGNLTVSGVRGLNNSVTFANGGTVGIAGIFTAAATFSGTGQYVVTNNTINFNGTGAQTVPAFSYNNLTLSGARTTNSVTLANGGTINVAGTFNPSATFTTGDYVVNNNTMNFNGTGAQTVPTFDYHNLTISGVRTINTSVTFANGGTVGVAGTFNPSATFSGTGQYVVTNNTIDFNGTGAQTVPAFTYNNLTLSGARTTNSVTLVSGGTITVQGTFNPSATFSSGGYVVTGNTINFNTTGAQTVPAFNYNNLTISGARTTNSVTLANGGTVGIAGTFNPSASFTSGGYVVTNNTVEYNGSAAQTLNVFTFANLRINNASGLTLSAGHATIGGTLTFTTGVVTTTGTNTVITTANCAAPSVSRTSGHVAGRLQKAIPTGASTCVFEVGGSTAADYTPVQTSYASVTSAGNVLAVVTAGDHPSLSGSGIDTTQSVNRYWTLNTPVTGALPSAGAGATYDALFTFVPAVAGEVDAGANALIFVIKRFSASWTGVTLGSRTATSTGGTTLLMTTGYGDFALGEPTVTNFGREQQFIYSRELY
jgi:hypothetical protein